MAARETLLCVMQTNPPFSDIAVENAFMAFPVDAREKLLKLRALIFDVAADTPEAGSLIETLKWGQPSYLTPTRSGTTIRLGAPKGGGVAIFTHCQTTVLSDFQAQFGDAFAFDGNRALLLPMSGALQTRPLRLLIKSALIYHKS